jgi:hypothetical protein
MFKFQEYNTAGSNPNTGSNTPRRQWGQHAIEHLFNLTQYSWKTYSVTNDNGAASATLLSYNHTSANIQRKPAKLDSISRDCPDRRTIAIRGRYGCAFDRAAGRPAQADDSARRPA